MEATLKIALLGSSGWVAHYLAPALRQRIAGAHLIGTYKTRKPDFDFPLFALTNSDHDAVISMLERENVSAVVNLTRGESEIDFAMHQRLIDYGNRKDASYFYLSSFNACDSQLTRDHEESELPSAQSDYGKFKARCERALTADSKRFAIFRFSSIHGWNPSRLSRTENFLQKLAAGQRRVVSTGIVQNRAAVTDLAAMIAAVVETRREGVFHLGTTDASEEVDFLKRMARAFGQDEGLIEPGKPDPTNANMVPGKILSLGGEFRRMEADTIFAALNTPELQKYKK